MSNKPKFNLDTEATLCILNALRNNLTEEERETLSSVFETRARHIERMSDHEYDKQVAAGLRLYRDFANNGDDSAAVEGMTEVRRTLH